MVTGWPEVRLTPYIGAVVLYVVLHSRDGARFSGGLHCAGGALPLSPLPWSSLLLLVLLALAADSIAVGFVRFLISAGVVLAGLAGASFTAGTACCCCFLLLALTHCLLFEFFLLLFLPGFLFLVLVLSRTAAESRRHE